MDIPLKIDLTMDDNIISLYEFVSNQAQSINNDSLEVERHFKSVLIATAIDLQTTINLLNESVQTSFRNQQQTIEEYVNHIKRSLILDIWGIIEKYIRDLTKTMCVEVKSRSQIAQELIQKGENSLKEIGEPTKNCLKYLKKAKKCLSNDFIEFPRIRRALFKVFTIENEKLSDWENFLDILSNMRNASHDGFIAGKTIDLSCNLLSKSFHEKQGITISYSEIRIIILGVIGFFRELETYKFEYENRLKNAKKILKELK